MHDVETIGADPVDVRGSGPLQKFRSVVFYGSDSQKNY